VSAWNVVGRHGSAGEQVHGAAVVQAVWPWNPTVLVPVTLLRRFAESWIRWTKRAASAAGTFELSRPLVRSGLWQMLQ
jgi:hypothetical protein